MAISLFGFQLEKQKTSDRLESFAPITQDDGAVQIGSGAFGAWGTYVDMNGTVRSEAELVSKYRQMAQHPELEAAIDDITNEAFMQSVESDTVDINLDTCNISENIKNIIRKEFDTSLHLLNFSSDAYEIFKRWYIDGRLYFHCIIDPKHTSKGIQELRYIDPRKIRKIREAVKDKDITAPDIRPNGKPVLYGKFNEYYLYNDRGFVNPGKIHGQLTQNFGTLGIKIATGSVVHCTSGLTSPAGDMVLGYLHKAIKPLNNLRSLEDAAIIYRISRAPERRVFYIDVGTLPKRRADQYMKDIMTKFKNRLVYNSDTGEISSQRKFMTMLDDFWFPRRTGNATQVDSLPSFQMTGIMEEIKYFEEKLYKSLYVPVTRLNADTIFTSGRTGEITRDEVKFSKFITRLRARFGILFIEIIKRQLVLKGIMTLDEFNSFAQDIKFDYHKDNYFAELQDHYILMDRLNILDTVTPYVGKYFSVDYVKKNILMQKDEEIALIQKEMDSDKKEHPEFFMMDDGMGNLVPGNQISDSTYKPKPKVEADKKDKPDKDTNKKVTKNKNNI